MVNDPARAAQFSKTLQEILNRSLNPSLDRTSRDKQLEILVEIIRSHVRTNELNGALQDWMTFTNTSCEDTSLISGWYRQEFLN